MTKILFVEDEASLLQTVTYILEREGYHVQGVGSGEEAISLAFADPPDLMLLDLNLPGIDGFEVCEKLYENADTRNVLIIMATGRGDLDEIVEGLETYADDYIIKPYQPKELIARIKAILRRNKKIPGQENQQSMKMGGISIDPDGREVKMDDIPVSLTKTEFDILLLLVKNPNMVLKRRQIIDAIRGDTFSVTERVVDYQLSGLRKKLGRAGEQIKTVRGVGYKFVSDIV